MSLYTSIICFPKNRMWKPSFNESLKFLDFFGAKSVDVWEYHAPSSHYNTGRVDFLGKKLAPAAAVLALAREKDRSLSMRAECTHWSRVFREVQRDLIAEECRGDYVAWDVCLLEDEMITLDLPQQELFAGYHLSISGDGCPKNPDRYLRDICAINVIVDLRTFGDRLTADKWEVGIHIS